MSLGEILLTLIIETYEGHGVATFYIPGVYLYTEMAKDKRILMNPRGGFVDYMCQVNPEYKEHVRYKNGKSCYTS